MDEACFIAVSEQYMPAFYRCAYSIVGNQQDAEDAVQQALMKAWRARAKARTGAERAWIMRIVLNECYNILRQRKHIQPLEDVTLIASEPTESRERALHEAIRALPENLRTPFLLKYMEGMSECETAAALGLTVSGVKSRLFRARKKLQSDLNEEVSL